MGVLHVTAERRHLGR